MKDHTLELVNYLLDQGEKLPDIFFIPISVLLDNGATILQLISLYPIEVEQIREDTMLGSCTPIIIDNTNKAALVDLDSLYIKENKARKLLAEYYSTRESKIEADRLLAERDNELKLPSKAHMKHTSNLSYRQDAISTATINSILPKINLDKNTGITNELKWQAFRMLENALKEHGAKNVKFFKDKRKDNSSVSGTDVDDTPIDVNYKAYRTRLPNLISARIAISNAERGRCSQSAPNSSKLP